MIEKQNNQPLAPPRNTELKRPLTERQIQAIYMECEKTLNSPEWILNKKGQRIGWRAISINAWCE